MGCAKALRRTRSHDTLNGSPVEGSSPHKEITRAELLHNRHSAPNASPRSPPGVGIGSHSTGRRGGAFAPELFNLTSTNGSFAQTERRARTEQEDGRGPWAPVSAQGARVASPGPPPPRRLSLPQRRYLFPHVIHDSHETRQQFSFFTSSKFLLGLLLAALLHTRGCHPQSATFTPGACRARLGAARCWGFCLPTPRPDCGCSALLPARPLRKDHAWRPVRNSPGSDAPGCAASPDSQSRFKSLRTSLKGAGTL